MRSERADAGSADDARFRHAAVAWFSVASLAPEAVAEHFGWTAGFVGLDMPASNARTCEALDWHPSGPGLLANPVAMDYRASP